MAWNFASDSTKLKEVSKELKMIADEIRLKTKDIYNLIENDLNVYWKSSTYHDFVSGCGNYKASLEDLAKTLEVFGEKIGNTSVNTEKLISDINNSIN